MLRSTDQVFALRGVAGAGKTTALKEFHAGVVAAGKSHVLLAPTTKAVEALRRWLARRRDTVVGKRGPPRRQAVIQLRRSRTQYAEEEHQRRADMDSGNITDILRRVRELPGGPGRQRCGCD